MPEENEMIEKGINEQAETSEQDGKKSKVSFIKVGIPVLLLQIIAAYFLANYVIVPRLYGNSADPAKAGGVKTQAESNEEENFGKIFPLQDVIVNPAESRGMQFVLVNFGFEVRSDSDVDLMKEREVQIRDILIKTISAHTLVELDGPEDKENLRNEIKRALKGVLPANHLMNVYFSNYIIQ